MKKTLIAVGAAAVVALIPAAAGFACNTALTRQVNLKTEPTPPSDHPEPDDDKRGLRSCK